MSVEIIPPGASAVVIDKDRDRDHHHDRRDRYDNDRYNTATAVVTDLTGERYGRKEDFGKYAVSLMEAVKDAEADLGRSAGLYYADTVKTIKDAESQLERSAGHNFVHLAGGIKDAETRLGSAAADRFIQTIQGVKDGEARLEKSAGDRFISITKDIKDVELGILKDSGYTRDRFLSGFERVARDFGEAKLENCKSFDGVSRDIGVGLRETLLQFKDTQNIQYRLAAEADKTACANQATTMMAFKDASMQLAECCCEIKSLVSSEANTTRNLINAQEVDRLRERASKAEAQLSLLELLNQVGKKSDGPGNS